MVHELLATKDVEAVRESISMITVLEQIKPQSHRLRFICFDTMARL